MSVKNNYLWISNLRVIATIAVIFLHVSSPLINKFGSVSIEFWNTANFFDALSRFCVPIFVMISGALLFDSNMQFEVFFRKRFTRIILPFLFWSFCYILYDVFFKTNQYTKLGIIDILKKIVRSIYFGNAYHLWYIYMIIGLFLFIPILNSWITRAKRKEIVYFLMIWFFTVLLKNFNIENYKPNIDLSFFSGYIGYLVLGYYLSTIDIKTTLKNKLLFLVCSIIGFSITFFATYWISVKKNSSTTFLYDFFSLNVLLTSVGIFMFFRISDFCNREQGIFFNIINKFSYGIYLIHVMILWTLDSIGISLYVIHPLLGIPITAGLCIVISTFVIKVINKLPFGKYISG